MTKLTSFPAELRVAVLGASGGVGQALVQAFADDPHVERVFAISRTPCQRTSPKIDHLALDLLQESSIEECAERASSGSPLDIVVVASGILWSDESISPEKSMRDLDIDKLSRVFAINAVGPAMVAKHFLPRMGKKSKTVFAALSARVGSIGDNRLGGWYSYRASKSALNMLLMTLSIEQARLWPKCAVVGLHPGTVDTRLSSPFTGRTPKDKLFSPEKSAGHLIDVINDLSPDDTGRVYAWDGQRIEN